MAAIKANQISPGDVLVLIGRGPMGAGMEETYQITSALRHLPFGKHVAVITDARFSGVSTGACVGHISPEALAGGPVGKLRDGDMIEIVVDRTTLEGTVNLVGENGVAASIEEGSRISSARRRGRTSRPIRRCRTTRASGRRCRTSAEGRGAGRFTTPKRYCARLPPARRRCPRRELSCRPEGRHYERHAALTLSGHDPDRSCRPTRSAGRRPRRQSDLHCADLQVGPGG